MERMFVAVEVALAKFVDRSRTWSLPSSPLLRPVASSSLLHHTPLVLFFALCVTISRIITNRNRKQQHPWPKVPGALPFIGNPLGPGGLSSFHSKVAEWAALYRTKDNPTGVLECNIFGKRYYIVCNNALASKIMSLRPHNIHKNPNVAAAAKSVGIDGIFAAEGTEWQQDRRLVAPALNHKAVMDYMPHLQAVTGRLLTKWKKDASNSPLHTITINHDLSCMTVDCIGRIAFGVDYNALGRPDSQEVKDVQFTFNRLLSRAMSPIKLWKSPMMARLLDPKASQVQQRIYQEFSRLIQQEQLRQQQNQVDHPTATFLSKIVRNSNGMPLHRLHGNLQTMLMAGSDTTSSALMVCFFKIASDQTGLQDELLEEANLLPDLEWPLLSLEVLLNTVPRIRSLFYEVVRFMGPGPQLMCQNKVALEVAPGVSIPPGSSLILPLQYLGTQPGSGIPPGPCGSPMNEFCARRWCTIDDAATTGSSSTSGRGTGRVTGVLKPSAKTGVPISTGFGGGVRICPGQLIAEAEAVLCLAFALREFHVSLPPDHGPLEMMSQLSAVPRCDIRLVLKERNNNVPPPVMT